MVKCARGWHRVWAYLLVGVLALAPVASDLGAQDPDRFPGVQLGLVYETGRRPVIAVQPIGVPAGATRDRAAIAETIQEILSDDFDYSDRFAVLRIPGIPAGTDVNYRIWDRAGAEWLVVGRLEPGSESVLYLALHDVVYGTFVHGFSVDLPPAENEAQFRMQIHLAADDLVFRATGEKGIAASRITFSIREPDGPQEIYVIDSDGHNLLRLTDHAARVANGAEPPISMSPNWSRDGLRLLYSSSYSSSGILRIRERILATAEDRELPMGDPGDQFYSPAYLGDGRIVASRYADGRSSIVTFDTRRDCCLETLSSGVVEVSPTVSPDGRRIAYASGKLGPSQIYTRVLSESTGRVLSPYSFGAEMKYLSPDWSPDGDRVVFHGELGYGNYQIIVADLSRSPVAFTQITRPDEGSNEDPSWGPDSRHVAFVGTRGSGTGLYVMDTVTGRLRRLLGGRRIGVPSWSPPVRPTGGDE